MIGHLITSTAESPGTNRLEIVGDKGKLIFDDGNLTFYRNRILSFEQIKRATSGFARVANWKIDIPFNHHGESGHKRMIDNFAKAIRHGDELIAPAVEGIHALTLGNAIMMSSFLGCTIELPMDGAAYAAKLEELKANSRFEKRVVDRAVDDLEASF